MTHILALKEYILRLAEDRCCQYLDQKGMENHDLMADDYTRNDTEQQLLLSRDTDPPSSRITDIGTMMEQAISSSASETQEVNNKVQEIMSTVPETFPRNAEDFERTRSRSPRGEASQPSMENTLQAPFVP